MGAGRRTLQEWEAGHNHPSVELLQALIQTLLEAGGFTAGSEAAEARQLWAAVQQEASRMHTPIDEVWLETLLSGRAPLQSTPEPGHAADWGEAPDVLGFVGRAAELATLREWVLDEQCRLISVLGMGGIGKTVLVAQLAQDIAPAFQHLYWRSARDAPPTSDWLAGAIRFLSDQQIVPPDEEGARLRVLVELLRERRNLLVLDNFETLLRPEDAAGEYRNGYAGYGRLLEVIGEQRHQSCLLVTSRESPPELARLVGRAVRSLQLGGLGVPETQLLLADKHLAGNAEEWANLVSRFGGNGLALKLVGESIHELFGRAIGGFLDETGPSTVFGGIRRVLDEQLARTTPLEHVVLRLLAVEREPVGIAGLLQALAPGVGPGAALEAIETLLRRSLVERVETPGAVAITLQSVVLEYVTDRMVEEVSNEIGYGRPKMLLDQPLIKAQAKDYLRQSQERLIGDAILLRLQPEFGRSGTEQRLLALLDGWRDRQPEEYAYGPGNVVNLLRLLRGDLRGLNLGQLTLRQVYLAAVEAQDARLAGAHLTDAILPEAFNFPTSLTLADDGTWLVVGTSPGEIRAWRVADRMPVLAVHGHTGIVWGLTLSADNRVLASGSEDGTVRVWSVPGGRLLATLRGQAGEVRSVALSRDGRLLTSGGTDGSIRLWELPLGRQVAQLQGHTGTVSAVAMSADGHLLASAGVDGILGLWDPTTAEPLATLRGHAGGVRGVALSGDGKLLASGGIDGTVRLWEAPGGRALSTLQPQAAPVWGVTLSRDGRLLASGSLDGTVRIWESSSGHLLATLREHTGGIRGVALSGDGRLLASGGFDGTIRLWDAPGGRLLVTVHGRASGVWAVASSTDGRLLASGSEDGTLRLWGATTGRLLSSIRAHAGTVSSVALTADGRYVASGGFDGIVRLWEVTGARLVSTMRGNAGSVRGLALSPDGRLLASASFDGTVRLWQAPTGHQLAVLRGHTGPAYGVALSASGHVLASCGEDGTVQIWDPASGRLLDTLRGHAGGVWGVALSADGRLLASGGVDRAVRLWELPSGRLLSVTEGHSGTIWGVALSADGRLVVSGGFDGTVRLWEVSSGRPLATLQGHTGMVVGVALSGDGRQLASGSFDGTVRVWDTTSGADLQILRGDRRYERADITHLTGVTEAQRGILLSLGAIEQDDATSGPLAQE